MRYPNLESCNIPRPDDEEHSVSILRIYLLCEVEALIQRVSLVVCVCPTILDENSCFKVVRCSLQDFKSEVSCGVVLSIFNFYDADFVDGNIHGQVCFLTSSSRLWVVIQSDIVRARRGK